MAETSGVELVTDRDVVGTVEHQIVGGDLRRQRRVFQPCVERRELNVGIHPRQRAAGGVDLRLADGGVAVQGLALKVGERHGIEIEQGKLADACRRQILRGGAAQPAEADDQHARGFQLLLTVKIEIAKNNLPVIAQHLRIAQLHAHYSPPNR